ncbi:MAG TPA: heavy metal-binding domain-containing protein [Ferruginibacter sp.]|nr:heavy metal-binding domain-containing protein [Ferruginibacter sp.]
MKKVTLSVLAMVFVLVACTSNSNKVKETTVNETTTMDTATTPVIIQPAAEQLYACSMHPEVTGKKNGKCSKCGMKLTVPLKK